LSAEERQEEKPSVSQIPKWFERKFEFALPVEHYPYVLIRLRGTPVRLEEILGGRSHQVLVVKPAGKWSAQEHAGHLLDLETLWMARAEDFETSKSVLTVADLSNRGTNDANHNDQPLERILARFRAARAALVGRVEKFPAEHFGRTLLHPRLQQPMRLVDHLYFVAEHDDHQLARIWELVSGKNA
jgi:hypothetical protein